MYKTIVILLTTLLICNASRVLELTDKFAEIQKDGSHWLIMFYAPWCGHCKRLEPVWGHVAQALYKTNVRVGRIDGTRFPALARELGVQGFPSIKLFKGEQDYTYYGDRTKEDFVNFAIRMSNPPVQDVTRPESLNVIKTTSGTFFMYMGPKEGPLWDSYYANANKFQPHSFFYAASSEIANQHSDIDEFPTIYVYKENSHYFFPICGNLIETNVSSLNDTLHDWVNEERFDTFQKVTYGNIEEILQTNKYLVLVVIEENKLQQIAPEMLEFRDMVESVIRKKKDKYHKNFQFGWVGNPKIANKIAMAVLSLPYLLVVNSKTKHHYIPEDEPLQLTVEAIDTFLEQIFNESVPAYGGSSFTVRMYRKYFELKTTLVEMWQGNPVLSIVLFGLPFGFLSLIFYSIFCQDILDADEEETDSLHHEKKE